MAKLPDCSLDRDKTRKFLRSPLGHYLAYRAYGGTLGEETPLLIRIGMMYHIRERQREFVNAIVGTPQELKAEGIHTIKTLAVPWAASLISPNEEGVEIANSEIMGTPLVLDKEKCPFFTGKKSVKKIKTKKRGKTFYGN